jgi:MarR family 2-MHQ and catechol resistance regulon transcriptional repressor
VPILFSERGFRRYQTPNVGGVTLSSEATAKQWVDEPATRDWSEAEERALRLWISLARCYATFSRAVSCKVAEYDLTAPQFGILEALLHLGPLSLGELAEKLLVTGGNITYVMDRLEAQGLVARERSGDDRRVVKAHLTSKGRATIEGVFPGHRDFIKTLVNGLDAEEQSQLRALLKKLGQTVHEEHTRGGNC